MAALASSLAHELTQPLTAILTNAEAVQEILTLAPPDLEEVRECISDIVKDDERAGEVIRRIRRLLEKEALELLLLSLTTLAESRWSVTTPCSTTWRSSSSCAPRFRSRTETPGPDPAGHPELADQRHHRAASRPTAGRRITVWTGGGEDYVELAVRDSGRGIAERDVERLFEPFFTTRPDGLGMGLVISRSIVEAHGGRIWGENDPDGGAVFRVHLPTSLGPS